MRIGLGSWLAVCSALCMAHAHDSRAAAPRLYDQPGYESPVRGEPDDLVLLAGDGFSADNVVVYGAIADTTRPVMPPMGPPSASTAEAGIAPVVNWAGLPRSLTIRLPAVMRAGQTYALWVRTGQGEWSAPVLINDARPLWFSPSMVYSSASVAELPRELKVVGRNLRPGAGAVTQIRLVGPVTVTGSAIVDAQTSDALNQYAVRLKLPPQLSPGTYHVLVSRDGVSWVAVADQTLEVRPDEVARPTFSVGDPQFGGCLPNDGGDDTGCILRAIAAAARAGGIVLFAAGSWDLIDSAPRPGLVANEGIIVPDGVTLYGAGAELTRLERHPGWSARAVVPAFTLMGHSEIRGFWFHDSQIYLPTDAVGPFLELGEYYGRVAAMTASGTPALGSVEDVVITGNKFDNTYVAIADAGLPIRRLIVNANEFGAYFEALRLTGDSSNVLMPFRIDDSVFDNNVFKPSSRLDTVHNTGVIASELGASRRVDFSGNVADGASTRYLYAASDPRGWSAAFFWNLNGNVENLLVSNNEATCTGDKTNSGEAIAFDNNGNTFGFDAIADVVAATATGLTASAPLRRRQNSRDVPVATFYMDHWIQVVSGPGLGQVRRITGYRIDPTTAIATFVVAPAWDVVPVAGRTRVAVGRQFWQVYAVANQIDHRQPLCQKSNRARLAGGAISMWAQVADSVIEGNRQYDTDGILTQQAYILPEHSCADCAMEGFFQYFLEIRANTIDGEYAWNNDCSASGITMGIAVAPWNDADPPTVSFGNSISHNIIRQADAAQGGAIATSASWYPGPPPYRWALSDNLLIHHNQISEVNGAAALAICHAKHGRIGISLPPQAIAWRTVQYANACIDVSVPTAGDGVDTAKLCPPDGSRSCECAGP